jgi:hypothetical protein
MENSINPDVAFLQGSLKLLRFLWLSYISFAITFVSLVGVLVWAYPLGIPEGDADLAPAGDDTQPLVQDEGSTQDNNTQTASKDECGCETVKASEIDNARENERGDQQDAERQESTPQGRYMNSSPDSNC